MLDPGNHAYFTMRTRCRVVTWEDVSPGDVVYFHVTRRRYLNQDEREQCHGPLTVVDPAARTLRNWSGFVVPYCSPDIRLLVIDPEPPRAAPDDPGALPR